MPEQLHDPSHDTAKERLRLRRNQILRPLAALAILGTLAGCAKVVSENYPDRHAPMSGEYSATANPDFYSDLKTISTTTPEQQQALESLATQPVAEWLPPDATTAATVVRDTLAKTRKDGSIPVFVSYAIPYRDAGGQSAGGLNGEQYTKYVEAVSTALGNKPAIMVVEPDALPHFPDLTDEQRTERISLLGDTLDRFYSNSETAVYIDAGNSNWRSPEETAGYLRDVAAQTDHGIQGISLNVSNFQSDSDSRAYATAVEKAYGSELYTLIDSSRNGNAGAMEKGDWCNPSNQKLGTADKRFDATARIENVFIKTPGESDGQCGVSQLPAGAFDTNLLIDQLR